jgi:transposase-like protein
MPTYKWTDLTTAQQNAARRIHTQLGQAGVAITVSQVAKYFDHTMQFARDEITAAEYAELTGAEFVSPTESNPASSAGALSPSTKTTRLSTPATAEPGETGVQPQEDDRIQCLECRRWYKSLSGHLGSAHGLTVEQYRARWGLTTQHPVAAPATRRRIAAGVRDQHSRQPRVADAFLEQHGVDRTRRSATPETRAAIAESARRPEALRRLRANTEKIIEATRERHERAARELGYASLHAALEATMHEDCAAAARRLGWSRDLVWRLRVQLGLATPRPPISAQQKADAAAQVLGGTPFIDVATRFEVSTDTLYSWMRDAAPQWKRQPTAADNGQAQGTLRARDRTDDQRRAAVAEVATGASHAEVARRYGVSDSAIHQWCRRFHG